MKNNSKNGEIKMKKLTQEKLEELTMRVFFILFSPFFKMTH
jgi:hypothetical protein